MKTLLGVVSVVVLLVGCSSPANREVRACEEFFSSPASVLRAVGNNTAIVVGLGDQFNGTSIGRALGEYGRSLQTWADHRDRNYRAPDWKDWDAFYYNASLYKIAIDQHKEIISRCDDLLTSR
jgi:hypothetical protein